MKKKREHRHVLSLPCLSPLGALNRIAKNASARLNNVASSANLSERTSQIRWGGILNADMSQITEVLRSFQDQGKEGGRKAYLCVVRAPASFSYLGSEKKTSFLVKGEGAGDLLEKGAVTKKYSGLMRNRYSWALTYRSKRRGAGGDMRFQKPAHASGDGEGVSLFKPVVIKNLSKRAEGV